MNALKLAALVIVAGGLSTLLVTPLGARQAARDLFERARMLEEFNQNLIEAIQLYQQAAVHAAENAAFAARAHVRVGVLYERLGRTAEARQAFQLVLTRYADQQTAVSEARTRLAALRETVAPQTSHAARLVWGGDGALVDGVVSAAPDGRFLAVTDWTTGDLAIRDLKQRTERRLTAQTSPYADGYAVEPRVSPDGKLVAFSWQKNATTEVQAGVDLRLIGVDGSRARVLYSNPEVDYVKAADWSPDGRRVLAAFHTRSRTVQIALVSVADSSAVILKTLPWGSLGRMSISPDGAYIAYDVQPREDSPSRSIKVLSFDATHEATLSESLARDEVFGWSPTGDAILFASDRTGTRELWSMPVASGKVQGPPALIRRDIGRIEPMGVTRNGDLYYSVSSATHDVHIARWDWKSGKLLSPPKAAGRRLLGVNRDPGWSPDGRYLAYISQPGGQATQIITVFSPDTGEERQLSPNLSRIFSGTYWSPDGRSLLLVGFDLKKRRGVYAIDAHTGDARMLVQDQDGQSIFDPEWLPDGTAIVYFRRDETPRTTSHLVIRDLESGRERELPIGADAPGFIYASLSPDGRRLAFVTQDDNIMKLRTVALAGGAPLELFRVGDRSGRIDLRGWTPNSEQVIFETKRRVGDRNVNQELWRVPAGGGERHRLPALGGSADPRLGFHPDGQQVAFTVGQGAKEIWVMENASGRANASR